MNYKIFAVSVEKICVYDKKGLPLHEKYTMMKRTLLIFACLLMALTGFAQRVIVVKANDVESLLDAVKQANKMNVSRHSERLYILIPDGLYDMGEQVLTRISGHNIAFIGQSMEKTIIRNAPAKENEGISKTAIFQNRGLNNYFQDLTLTNELDYYTLGNDGRAVTLQDKGKHTIYNRIRMLSHQDTYYADKEDAQHYMQDTEIHGTVDFICGAGDIWFERCRLVTEKRSADGSGENVIVATRTAETHWGYVFNRCTIENRVSNFYYARAWHTYPRCVWLRTTLLNPDKLMPSRFDTQGMKVAENYFKEYRTKDVNGKDITPKSNVLTFTVDNCPPYSEETIMTDAEAKQYTMKNIFGDWKPAKQLKKIEKQANKLKQQML